MIQPAPGELALPMLRKIIPAAVVKVLARKAAAEAIQLWIYPQAETAAEAMYFRQDTQIEVCRAALFQIVLRYNSVYAEGTFFIGPWFSFHHCQPPLAAAPGCQRHSR